MNKVIKLNVASTKEVFGRFATALGKARKGQEVSHDEVSFESIESLRNILTRRRLEILSLIRCRKPNSIHELSKILDRDLKSVNTDLKVLKENDFLHFKKVKNGRVPVVPVVDFDKIDIEVKV